MLRWTPESPGEGSKSEDAGASGGAAPHLFTAIREQLGLKLEAGKAEVGVYVVDRAERPSEN